jgi:hypothetical protein
MHVYRYVSFGIISNALEKHLESLDMDTRRQLDKDFRAVVAAVEEHKKSGSYTLTIALKPNGGKVIVATSGKPKLPTPTIEATVRWFDKDGGLADEDPRQQKLPLRNVTPLKTVQGE